MTRVMTKIVSPTAIKLYGFARQADLGGELLAVKAAIASPDWHAIVNGERQPTQDEIDRLSDVIARRAHVHRDDVVRSLKRTAGYIS